jgi:hypothetical protein
MAWNCMVESTSCAFFSYAESQGRVLKGDQGKKRLVRLMPYRSLVELVEEAGD